VAILAIQQQLLTAVLLQLRRSLVATVATASPEAHP